MGDAPSVLTTTPRSHRGTGDRLGAVGRRALLAAVGLGLVAWLVYGAGPERVADVLWQARAWIPVIVALELTQVAGDLVTLRMLLGRAVRPAAWVRSTALAYAMMILVPAGRAAGEVGRAAILSKEVGAARAASASLQLQSAYVFAIGVLSAVEGAVVLGRMGPSSPLGLLLAANAAAMFLFSAGLLAVLWHARIGSWLERVLRRLSHLAHDPADAAFEAPRSLPWRAAVVCTVTRAAQALQYAAILHAVGGRADVVGALATHGIHLVAATVGDVLPNGLGIVDGTYRAFATDVGFGAAPARALSIAFVAHLAQLIVASVAVVVLSAARSGQRERATGAARGGSPSAEDGAEKPGEKSSVRASPAE